MRTSLHFFCCTLFTTLLIIRNADITTLLVMKIVDTHYKSLLHSLIIKNANTTTHPCCSLFTILLILKNVDITIFLPLYSVQYTLVIKNANTYYLFHGSTSNPNICTTRSKTCPKLSTLTLNVLISSCQLTSLPSTTNPRSTFSHIT
jgi:hypothetical protein